MAILLALAALALPAAAPEPISLHDHPIASGAPPAYLDGAWTAQHSGQII
jgi:hypothetical protein